MKKASPTTKTLPPSAADALALKAFQFLADNEVRLARFLSDTGIEPETVRQAARSPAFLRGVLDYVLGDTDLLVEVAEAVASTPETLHIASRSMSKPPQQQADATPALKPVALPAKGAIQHRRSLFRDLAPGEAA